MRFPLWNFIFLFYLVETINCYTVSASSMYNKELLGDKPTNNFSHGSSVSNSSYQHIIVSGLPFNRGQSHGQQAKDKILANLARYKSSSSMPPWADCLDFVRDHYVPALEKYYPNGLEEMRGIASGANISLDEVIILNARYELTRWKRWQNLNKGVGGGKLSSETPECKASETKSKQGELNPLNNVGEEEAEECTGAVALKSSTKNQHVLLGQNWDTSEFILNNDTAILLEVHPHPCENIKPFVMLTEAGQLGRSGMNADGLGIVAMSLWSTDEIYTRNTTNYPFGWIPTTLLRRMFLEAPNFSIGLRSVLQLPRHVSVNMIVATNEDEALNIELTPTEYFISQVPLDHEILTHSNHFKAASFITRDDIREGSRGSSSLFRDRRVEKYLRGASPSIDEFSFQEAFKDHVGYPNSVCEHSVPNELAWTSTHPTETTVASIIFNLSKKTMQLCKGPPCEGIFKNYNFSFSSE